MATFGLTLDLVKAFLGYSTGSPNDAGRDMILQLWLNAAIAYIQQATGRNLELATYRDTFSYRPKTLYLQEYPITNLISITHGTSVLAVDTDFQVFAATGRVEFKNMWATPIRSYWMHGYDDLKIDYVGGYTALPDVMVMAALVGIQAAEQAHVQMTTYGGAVKQITVVDVGTTAFQTKQNATSAALQNAINDHLADFISNIPVMGTPLLHETERIGDAPGSP